MELPQRPHPCPSPRLAGQGDQSLHPTFSVTINLPLASTAYFGGWRCPGEGHGVCAGGRTGERQLRLWDRGEQDDLVR